MFIHVGIGLLVLLGFTAFVVDYGILLVSRNQAQNSADAAALAGAAALTYDGDADDRWDRARNVAWNTGIRNVVWSDEPGVVPTSPYSGPPCDARDPDGCIRVDVFRDGSHGSRPLATWFAGLFGVASQHTRAMAVAESAPASGTDCLKPWLIPNRFEDHTSSPGQFDEDDVYVRPTMNDDGSLNRGTGYSPQDIGMTLTLKVGDPHDAIAPGNFYAIDDPEFDVTGGSDYRDAIAGCVLRRSIGDIVSIKDGNMKGPTRQGFERLIAEAGGEATVIIGMFDPADYADNDRQSGNQPIQIVNMLAFTVNADSYDNAPGSITGTIAGAPSTMATVCTIWPCPTSSGLVNVIRLVR